MPASPSQNGFPDADGPLLVVYGRSWCHLCEDMLKALETLRGEYRFRIEQVDVDADEALEHRYGEWVPVLVGEGRELCHYFLDADAVRGFLAEWQAR